MSEEPTNHEIETPVVEIDGNLAPVVDSHHLDVTQQNLDRATEKGISIGDLLKRPDWQNLEIDTASGRIVLKREDVESDTIVGTVLESEDPSVKVGEVIVLEGMTMTGGIMKPGVFGPGARVAFRRRTVVNYHSDPTRQDEHYISSDEVDKYVEDMPGNAIKTETGMDLVHYASRGATDLVDHALIVGKDEQGEPQSQYLF